MIARDMPEVTDTIRVDWIACNLIQVNTVEVGKKGRVKIEVIWADNIGLARNTARVGKTPCGAFRIALDAAIRLEMKERQA